MPKLTFYPLGNADCCLMDLADGRKLLFDYANTRCGDDPDDKRVDLPGLLRENLENDGRETFEVVAFTHLDDDHICGSSDFFELGHSAKHQGGDRVKIEEMWVPAFMITEAPAECSDEAKLIQAEARHRLKQSAGIRVFSRPDALKDWLRKNGIDFEKVKHLITDAGQLVPGFTTDADGVEFFAHSPFALHQDNGTFEDRNTNSLVLQVTFLVGGAETKVILAADSTHEVLKEIVNITKAKAREERLEWDVMKLPHHCSYKSLAPDRGSEQTVPIAEVEWLFETQGKKRSVAVSTSCPIPAKDADDDDNQPPHRQAASYHRKALAKRDGEFKVTMEHPSESSPKPLVIVIDKFGATLEKRSAPIAAAIISRPAPRAG